MGVLEQVLQMKKQGISDEEIIGDLTKQKISPREINDALKQAQIKNAVSDFEDADMQPSLLPNAPAPQEDYSPQSEEYTPNPQKEYVPQTVGYSSQGDEYAPETQEGEGYVDYQQGGGIDTDTVMEIAGQIFSERIKKIQAVVEDTSDNNNLLQSKLENLSERLKKIETTIDKLQIAILERVGSYGQNLDGIRKEMSMMQDSFSKMLSSPKEEPYSQQEPQMQKPRRQNAPLEQESPSEMPDEFSSLQKKISKKK
jgi:hypothetical protein